MLKFVLNHEYRSMVLSFSTASAAALVKGKMPLGVIVEATPVQGSHGS